MRMLLTGFLAAMVQAAAAAPNVVADIPPVASLVAQVMEGAGGPLMIGDGVSDPHGGALRPSDARAISDADIIFWVGPGLTPWLERPLDRLGETARVVALSEAEGVTQRPFREEAVFALDLHNEHDDHDDDHSDDHGDRRGEDGTRSGESAQAGEEDHDHDHGAFDPHLWLDPANAAAWVDAIAGVLAEADPENAALYAANAEAARSRLDALAEAIAGSLAGVDPAFIVEHDALGHFEARFATSAIAALSDSDAARPGPRRVEAVRRAAREAGAICFLVEPGQGRRSGVEGVRMIEIDPLGLTADPGPNLYAEMMRGLAAALAGCGR